MGLLKLFPLDFKKSEKNGLLVKSYCLPLNFSKRGVQPKNATSGLHDSKMCKNWLSYQSLFRAMCLYKNNKCSFQSQFALLLSRHFYVKLGPQFGIYCKKEANHFF